MHHHQSEHKTSFAPIDLLISAAENISQTLPRPHTLFPPTKTNEVAQNGIIKKAISIGDYIYLSRYAEPCLTKGDMIKIAKQPRNFIESIGEPYKLAEILFGKREIPCHKIIKKLKLMKQSEFIAIKPAILL